MARIAVPLGRGLPAVLAALAVTAPAAAQDFDAREAAIFGAPEPASAAPSANATTNTPPSAGQVPTTVPAPSVYAERADGGLGALIDRTAAADDKLAIGGLLYLRLGYSAAKGNDPEDEPLTSPNLLDLYLDARPNERLRAFAQGRLRYDPTYDPGFSTALFAASGSTAEVALDQLWLKFDIARRVYVTAGKQPLKWGSGRFWNPTDFLHDQVRDPLAVFDERLGLPLVKLHVPFESPAINLYAIATFDDADSPGDVGGALRAELAVATAEFALAVAGRADTPLLLAADVSAGLGPIDVHGEAALRTRDDGPYWRGDLNLNATPPTLPSRVDRADDWIGQAVIGAEYSVAYGADDSLTLGAEYFFNDAGYDNPDVLLPWLVATESYRPLYAGRHYAGFYGLLPGPRRADDVTFIGSTLANLSDGSWLTRFDARWTVLTFLSLDAAVTVHYRADGELRPALDLPPLAGVPELADGLSLPPPVVDVSVGARVRF